MKKQNDDFLRAQNLVSWDETGFRKDKFSCELKNFLANYFDFSSLTVQTTKVKPQQMVICINVTDIKKSRLL